MVNASGARATNACDTCRKRKVKCSGGKPCENCVKHDRECVVGDMGRKRYSESYVQRLLARLKVYEHRLSQHASSNGAEQASVQPLDAMERDEGDEQQVFSPMSGPTETAHPQSTALPSNHDPPNATDGSPGADNQETSPSTVDLASGPALNSHLRSLVNEHTGKISSLEHRTSDNADGEHWRNEFSATSKAEWLGDAGLLRHHQHVQPPSVNEGLRLYRLFMRYMGDNQHFLDDRAFTDSLTLLSRSPGSRAQLSQSLWYLEYLLVMSIGKLLDDDPGSTQPPGIDYFSEALRRLPPLHELGNAGSVAVEILALTGTYLQWIGKSQDAYIYVGSGLRLAVALGYSQPYDEFDCVPSEAAHRVRLFWTLYMLDRRLASSLGLPVGVNNKQVKADIPWESPGFGSPIPICINIKLAHTTGEIMCSLYGNTTLSRAEYIKNIEAILIELRGVSAMIPDNYKVDFSKSTLDVTRAGASLYLMLYQAILLCLRPIILQKVRIEANSQPEGNSTQFESETFKRLAETCRDAASRSIRLLSALRQKNMLARFGFFDLDATFSAAFILVMMGIIEGTSEQHLPPEIQAACDLLRFFTKAGNESARGRLEDVTRFCASIWRGNQSDFMNSSAPGGESGNASQYPNAAANNADATGGFATGTRAQTSSDRAEPVPFQTTLSPPLMPGWDNSFDPTHAMDSTMHFAPGSDVTEDVVFDLAGDAECIYTSFNEPSWPLTGIDQNDWMEMERMIGQNMA